MSAVSFTPERLEKLLEIDRYHFWFLGRRKLVDDLLSCVGGRGTLRVLDLGSGAGTNAERMSARGNQVTAVDFLPAGLDALRQRAPRVAVVQASAEAVALRQESFDVVMLLDVIEHLDDERVLREAARLLCPGGAVVVTVPAFAWLWSYRDDAAGHKRRYSRRLLEQRLTAAGFRIERFRYYQCLLFPLAVLTRLAGKRDARLRDIEDVPPSMVNRLFSLINSLEVFMGKVIRWPWGSTLAAVARKAG